MIDVNGLSSSDYENFSLVAQSGEVSLWFDGHLWAICPDSLLPQHAGSKIVDSRDNAMILYHDLISSTATNFLY